MSKDYLIHEGRQYVIENGRVTEENTPYLADLDRYFEETLDRLYELHHPNTPPVKDYIDIDPGEWIDHLDRNHRRTRSRPQPQQPTGYISEQNGSSFFTILFILAALILLAAICQSAI